MKNQILPVLSIVFLVAIFAFFNLASAAEPPLFVYGHIWAHERDDDYTSLCRGPMRAVAQPGNIPIGNGEVYGGTFSIYLQPGWEKSNKIDFDVFDVAYAYCNSISVKDLKEKINVDRAKIELPCNFEKFGCSYYVEYWRYIEDEEPQRLSKLRYVGTGKTYKHIPYPG